MKRIGAVVWLGAAALLVGACAARPESVVFRARPATADQDWGDRVHAELRGIRVVLGPAAAFPFERAFADGERETGLYQIFTRLRVHNAGDEAVEILWSEARLYGPAGAEWRLLEAGERWPGARGRPAPEPPDERLAPGEVAARALIPDSILEIGVGEPLVPLCDGCEFRLVLRVRSADDEFGVEARFRLEEERGPGRGGGRTSGR